MKRRRFARRRPSPPGASCLPEQQAALSLHRTHDLLVRQRTQLVKMIRGLLAGYRVTSPDGIILALAFVRRGVAHGVSMLAGKVISAPAEQALEDQGRIRQLERDLLAWHRTSDFARRIATAPGMGLLSATAWPPQSQIPLSSAPAGSSPSVWS